jgi:predicted membrane metal-binding protein
MPALLLAAGIPLAAIGIAAGYGPAVIAAAIMLAFPLGLDLERRRRMREIERRRNARRGYLR